METPVCQSCGMPMTATEHFGTNKDLSANREYCCYCFDDGQFTEELTMEEMMERYTELVEEYHHQTEKEFNREETMTRMQQYFPLLKRWRVAQPDIAYFASGCFWGTEYHLMKAQGVAATAVGFMGGDVDHPTYEQVCTKRTGHVETVEVTFDAGVICYESLVKLFFETHDFCQTDGQGPDIGPQYRSVIFFRTPEQKEVAQKTIDILKEKGYEVATELRPAPAFWIAEEYHQQYYDKKGALPYCHIYRKIF